MEQAIISKLPQIPIEEQNKKKIARGTNAGSTFSNIDGPVQ